MTSTLPLRAFTRLSAPWLVLLALGAALIIIGVVGSLVQRHRARTVSPRLRVVETLMTQGADGDRHGVTGVVWLANASDVLAHVEVVQSAARQKPHPFRGAWVDDSRGEMHGLALVRKHPDDDFAQTVGGGLWTFLPHGYHKLLLTLVWDGAGSPARFPLHLFVNDYGGTATLWSDADWQREVMSAGGEAPLIQRLLVADEERAARTERYGLRQRMYEQLRGETGR